MSSSYTGNNAAYDLTNIRAAVTETIPADADAANAASVNSAFQTLADTVASMQTLCAFVGNSSAINPYVLDLEGVSGDTNPCGQTLTTPTARKLFWQFKATATPTYGRIYFVLGGYVEFTSNCGWNGTAWVPDVNSIDAVRFSTGHFALSKKIAATGVGGHLPASWSDDSTTVPLTAAKWDTLIQVTQDGVFTNSTSTNQNLFNVQASLYGYLAGATSFGVSVNFPKGFSAIPGTTTYTATNASVNCADPTATNVSDYGLDAFTTGSGACATSFDGYFTIGE